MLRPKTESPGPAACAQVVEWAKANTIDFVVVGPEDFKIVKPILNH